MTAHKFEPVIVVCDDCGAELAHTHGTPYMEGTVVIRPELIRTHDCPGKPMCACGHTRSSHAVGECVGCTGRECGEPS